MPKRMEYPDSAPRQKLALKYDGPALKGGRMPAYEAGRAIAAAGRLVELSSKHLLGGDGQVTVEVDSQFREGSFEIAFSVVPWVNVQIGLIADPVLVKAVASVFGSFGLLWAIKELKGVIPDNININLTGNKFTFLKGGDHIEVDGNVGKLLMDGEAIEASRTLVEPLKKEGIDSLQSDPHNGKPLVLVKDDVRYFNIQPPPPEKVDHTEVSNPLLRIEAIVYNKGHKWHFSAGGSSYWAKITDKEFWDEISSGRALPMGTALHVEMVTKHTLRGGKVDTEHTITKVHKIFPGHGEYQEELPIGA